jgi:hypothetical protein
MSPKVQPGNALGESQRDSVIQPSNRQGKGGRSYPGKTSAIRLYPERVAAFHSSGEGHCYNPFRVADYPDHEPRVARASQPWSGWRNPFGIRGLPRLRPGLQLWKQDGECAASGALPFGCPACQARLGDCANPQLFPCAWPLDWPRSMRPSRPSTTPGFALAPLTATSGTMRTLRSPTICMSCIVV